MDSSVTGSQLPCHALPQSEEKLRDRQEGIAISSKQAEGERGWEKNRAGTDLEAALVEPLDGDGDAVRLCVGRAYEALVDAPEAALAELLRAAEVGRGGLQLRVLERAQLAVAPLLVQRRDAVLRRRAPRLAHGAHRRAGVVGAARAAHHRPRGGRGRRRGRAARPRGDRALGPPLEAAEVAHPSPARNKLAGPVRAASQSRERARESCGVRGSVSTPLGRRGGRQGTVSREERGDGEQERRRERDTGWMHLQSSGGSGGAGFSSPRPVAAGAERGVKRPVQDGEDGDGCLSFQETSVLIFFFPLLTGPFKIDLKIYPQ
jgi:hypothetical protein